MSPTVRILGTHGVPANYGGFETAAENIARHLVTSGWRVIVYCQVEGTGPVYEDVWHRIERVNIPIDIDGWLGTSKFDLVSIRHACEFRDVCLTFGYNTAVFNILQRIKGIPNVINMDGIEWSRARWGKPRQAVLYINERIACYVGNRLIADHPEIEKYLLTRAPQRKLETITYGADAVSSAPETACTELGLVPGRYISLIARPIPENSVLEIVQGFSKHDREVDLVILGNYNPDSDEYHREVVSAAADRVRFVGAIYEPATVQALRFHSIAYVHGHTVGGTNPSLVEAMAAGNAIVAHDNPYNHWVAGDAGVYFDSADTFDDKLTKLLDSDELRQVLSCNARARHSEEFTWEHVAKQYENLLLRYAAKTVQDVEPEEKC